MMVSVVVVSMAQDLPPRNDRLSGESRLLTMRTLGESLSLVLSRVINSAYFWLFSQTRLSVDLAVSKA